MAKIPIGEKVFVINTGELGVVINYFDEFNIVVDVDGELRKVHKTSIVAAKEFGLKGNKTPDKKIDTRQFKNIPGLSLVFKSIKNAQAEILRYEVFLVNNFDEELLFEYELYLSQTLQHKIRKEIGVKKDFFLHEFKSDQLNDAPLFKFLFWLKSVESGRQNHFEKLLKIKPKVFFCKA